MTGGREQQRGPTAEYNCCDQLPYPHPGPGSHRKQEMPVTRACSGRQKKGGPLRSALKPLKLGTARLHLADQRGWACCATSSKPGSRGTEHQRLFLAFKTFPMPASLSLFCLLPSRANTHSTSQCQSRGSDRHGSTPSPAAAS